MSKVFSRDIAGAIDSFLRNDKWHFSFDESKGLFRFGLAIKGKMKSLDYVIDVKKDEFITYAIAPLSPDEDDSRMMARMCEFITRANYGLKNGCFEMDFEDGELRYRSFVDCEHQMPSQEVIKNSIYATASTFSRYAPGILDILFTDAIAKDAVAKCEGGLAEMVRKAVNESQNSHGGEVDEMLSRLSARLGLSDRLSDSLASNATPMGGDGD